MLALAIFCAILQCGFNLIIDFLFDDILASPTSKKASVTKSIGATIRNVVKAVRQRSNSVAPFPEPADPVHGGNKVFPDHDPSVTPVDYEVHGFFYHSKDRKFPAQVVKLHEYASNSIISLRRGFLEPVDRFDLSRNSRNSTVFGATVENADVERTYEMLIEKIAIQRGSLNPIERQAFDTEWRLVALIYYFEVRG
jgi:hypothetical protein